jgi:hypothetical protein
MYYHRGFILRRSPARLSVICMHWPVPQAETEFMRTKPCSIYCASFLHPRVVCSMRIVHMYGCACNSTHFFDAAAIPRHCRLVRVLRSSRLRAVAVLFHGNYYYSAEKAHFKRRNINKRAFTNVLASKGCSFTTAAGCEDARDVRFARETNKTHTALPKKVEGR